VSAAILGWAWRTPLGASIDRVVGSLLAGERAARPNERFPVESYACRLAAPIGGDPASSPHRRFLDRLGLFGVEVAMEALAMAEARASGDPTPTPPQGGARNGGEQRAERNPGSLARARIGLFCGVGGLRVRWGEILPALAAQRPDGEDAWERGLRRLHPFWMLKHLSNNAHALISVEARVLGEGATFGGATAGAQAIAAAARALDDGAIDRALVVAYDALIDPEALVELAERGVVTRDPLERLRAPYDARAAGVVPGEAAAALVLARAADTPGAFAIVDAAGGADGNEGEPDAALLAGTAARLLGSRGPAAIVDGAARARPDHDAAERAALARVVGEEAPLVAIAAATGALGAATAMVQAIALAEVLRRGALPPIAGIERPAAGPLRPIAAPEPTRARAAIGLSSGAPGLAAAVRVEVDR
jgi:3-oxoacyl-(acyl-carrier-protein) synthase